MANIFHATQGFEGVPSGVRRAMIVANNGTFMLRRLIADGHLLIEATTPHGPGWSQDGLVNWQEGVTLNFVEKLPWEMLQRSIAFFKTVFAQQQSEALILPFYCPSAPAGRRWNIEAPIQKANGSRVKGKDPMDVPDGWLLAGSIHSHASHPAGHSSTDDVDERFKDGIHITVGNINTLNLSFSASVVISGHRFRVDLADLVEGIPTVEFPQAWLGRVSKLEDPKLVFQFGQITQQGQKFAKKKRRNHRG